LNGCCVVESLQDQKAPNTNIVQLGANRSDVDAELGAHGESRRLQHGHTLAIYEYRYGNQPASAKRAAEHALMDVLTLGIWEVTMFTSGWGEYTGSIVVLYNPDNQIVLVEHPLGPVTINELIDSMDKAAKAKGKLEEHPV
ncbi:MAG TPA: hypothetical protein PLV25_08025, partial [Opitutales bacterium]|nr:hypothetical protein [Opitutales bacterium]